MPPAGAGHHRDSIPAAKLSSFPPSMNDTVRMASAWLARIASPAYWKSLPGHYREWRARHTRPITDREGLRQFIYTRSAHVAQTSLYGYLRTRAGTRFPELFSDDEFLKSINIAKWHVWLACVSDLAIYAGAQARRGTQEPDADVAVLMQDVVDAILREAGEPAEAGGEYGAHAERVRARLAMYDWRAVPEAEGPFTQSPAALVYWAPIVDELKALDEEIVRNSVRFRWQEVREEFNRLLDADAVLRTPLQKERDGQT
jgi:hypothetical protein